MSKDKRDEIRRRLDDELSLEEFESDPRPTEAVATQFFQDLFVQPLEFDMSVAPTGQDPWQELPVHRWPKSARANAARLFAQSGNFRVIYVELEKLTRTAERNAIQSLTDRGGWAIEGSFLTVFHAPDEDIWHLVTPYEEDTDDITTGRPVLRRYTLGEGETHRTVAKALEGMDASQGRLAERIDDAFSVKPVTEDFYEDYRSNFKYLSKNLRKKGLEIEEADQYAHTTLNRLMFFYYLQKKGWIGGRKEFVRWFHDQYEQSDDTDCFHEKWLSALFFDGMNRREGEPTDTDLPEEVENVISELAYMNGGLFHSKELDENDVYLSDDTLHEVIRGFLEEYNFTITEESPYDIDVAVDPAMLGKIYESLIAEQERDEVGIYYTPRVEVDLMCRMALYEQFCTHTNGLDERQIVEFIFSEPHDWNREDEKDTEALEGILHELSIVDPACGSGAFLVGMKQVLAELYRKLGTTPDFDLKEQIINENLYGVDIKDWAVRVAEFRLWLSLVEGEDELPEHRPILPNFTFKLNVGDSIVQQVDDEFVSLEAISRNADETVNKRLSELESLKKDYFGGAASLESEIKDKQFDVVETHINSLIEKLEDNTVQSTLGNGVGTVDSSGENVEKRIKNLEETRDALRSAQGNFFWKLDFSEVMLDGGFDIVIGNPPYVPKGRIIDQSINPERIEQMDSDEVRQKRNKYKKDLQEYVERTFGIKPSRHSDLYVHFFFKGLDLLNEDGTLSLVTSNAWLSQNYGKKLQSGLLQYGHIKTILENSVQRTFADADVNTTISIINKTSEKLLSGETSFTGVSKPYEEFISADSVDEFLHPTSKPTPVAFRDEKFRLYLDDNIRQIVVDEPSLWRLGGGETPSDTGSDVTTDVQTSIKTYSETRGVAPEGAYSSGRWGVFFRAPTIFFELLERGMDRIEPLTRIADNVRRGMMTGADDFFYLPAPGSENAFFEAEQADNGDLLLFVKDEVKDRFTDQGFRISTPMFRIEREYVMGVLEKVPEGLSDTDYLFVDSSGRSWLPNYVVEGPRDLDGWQVAEEQLQRVVLLATDDKGNLETGVTEYIEWGESWEPSRYSKYPDRQVCSTGRDYWYSLENEQHKGGVLFPKRVDRAYATAINTAVALANQNVHSISYSSDPAALCAVLNAASTWLALEITGNRGLGGGALEVGVSPTKEVEIPNPTSSDIEHRELLENAPLSQSIFRQLNAKRPEEFEMSGVMPGRRELDKAVMGELIGLDEREQKEVYEELLQLVQNRIAKSESV